MELLKLAPGAFPPVLWPLWWAGVLWYPLSSQDLSTQGFWHSKKPMDGGEMQCARRAEKSFFVLSSSAVPSFTLPPFLKCSWYKNSDVLMEVSDEPLEEQGI